MNCSAFHDYCRELPGEKSRLIWSGKRQVPEYPNREMAAPKRPQHASSHAWAYRCKESPRLIWPQ